MAVIDSPQNPRIQAAFALRDRRERLDSGQTIVDGARECRRAIEARVPVVAAFVCRELIRTADAKAAVARLTAKGIAEDRILEQAFITPSCGTGTLTVERALRVIEFTAGVSASLRK